jgi:hypothetical protein
VLIFLFFLQVEKIENSPQKKRLVRILDLGLGFGWVAFTFLLLAFVHLSRLWVLVLSFTFPPFLSGLVLFRN